MGNVKKGIPCKYVSLVKFMYWDLKTNVIIEEQVDGSG